MKTALALAGTLSLGAALVAASDYLIQPVPFTAVRLTGGFWHTRQELNRTVTIPFALQQCEDTGRVRNFDLAAETMRRRAAGETAFQHQPPTQFPFDDSDVFKAIEGAAYALSIRPDPALASRLDTLIARIAAAQEPDGYLYTWRTMHPDSPAHKWIDRERWVKDPDLSHELYNIGHLYEAGVAHFQATGKRSLLEVCLRSADLVWRDFGDRRRRLAPGHQVIEMGLVKLYRVTGDRRYLELAQIFLDARGPGDSPYNQRHQLVVDQDAAVGHAVRANYLYAGLADVAALTGDRRYVSAITKIWDDVAQKKMYLTGSVGALRKGEAYGAAYELPLEGYNETCAAIAFMMWNHRMFLLTGDSKYIDVLERAAYNGALSGVSLSGDRFFYTNPVAYDGAAKINHGFAGRAPWFGCACCPPNVVRTLAALTGYFYASQGDALFVNLYGQSAAEIALAGTTVRIAQTTDYPWQGAVRLTVSPAQPAKFALRVRLPGFAQGRPVPSDLYAYDDQMPAMWSARLGREEINGPVERGYLVINRRWQPGDMVELVFGLPVRTVRGHPEIAATKGRAAFERGPLVYCAEDADRTGFLDGLTVPPGVKFGVEPRPLLGGVQVVTIAGAIRSGAAAAEPLALIPYYAWNNRGNAPMTVWFRRFAP